MIVRPATDGESETAIGILDAAALETDTETVQASIAADRTLVAVAEGRVLGAAVCYRTAEGGERALVLDAIAVRPGRRGQGIGTELVERALERFGRVEAAFDPGVRPFYASLGFDIEPMEDGDRRYGVRETSS
jgi:GNAT superfamily N-acetyltransferase